MRSAAELWRDIRKVTARPGNGYENENENEYENEYEYEYEYETEPDRNHPFHPRRAWGTMLPPMTSFRFKVLLFSLPLLLPIGRVEITGSAKTDSQANTPAPARAEHVENLQPEPDDPDRP